MEKKVTDDFLDGLGDSGADPFEPSNNDDLFPEDTETVVEPKEDTDVKPVPFHKDEKVQKYLDKQLRKQREELIRELKPSAQETFTREVSESGDADLVNAFTAIIGNDTPEKIAALSALEKSLKSVDERATKKAVERLQQVQKEQVEQETAEAQKAEEELESGFEEIEDHFGIELNDRQKSEYKKFLLKIEPRGGYIEYPDFVETFEVFKSSIKRPSNSQAKALASRGMERSSSAEVVAPKLAREGTKSLWQTLEGKF